MSFDSQDTAEDLQLRRRRMALTAIKGMAGERYLSVEDFRKELGQLLGVKPPGERWVRDLYRERDMPVRTVLNRYRMIPWNAALDWLRAEKLIPEENE